MNTVPCGSGSGSTTLVYIGTGSHFVWCLTLNGYIARLLALLGNFYDYAWSFCPWLSDDHSFLYSRRTSCWFFEKSWVRREQAAREIPPSPPPRSDNEPLSIEQGRAVLYRDFVTILWGASMEYITKLVTLQSQEHRFPPLPEFIMYDAIVWCVSCLIGQSPIPKAWLRIRIHFIRTRIQHFRLNTDQDPIRIQIRSNPDLGL
jgi:hypothetical protein